MLGRNRAWSAYRLQTRLLPALRPMRLWVFNKESMRLNEEREQCKYKHAQKQTASIYTTLHAI